MNRYHIRGWQEKTLHASSQDLKVNQASIKQEYEGAITGTGDLAYLMVYKTDQTVDFTGVEWLDVRIDGKSGTVALQHVGKLAQGKAIGTFEVVPASASGELVGLTGSGRYQANEGRSVDYEFEYSFD